MFLRVGERQGRGVSGFGGLAGEDVPIERHEVSSGGWVMNRQTLEIMAGLIRESQADEVVQRQTRAIVASLPAKAHEREVDALLRWVQMNIRYVRDPLSVKDPIERIQTPRYTLEVRQGDCDDLTVILGSFAASVGLPVKLIGVGDQPGSALPWPLSWFVDPFICHVYLAMDVAHDGEASRWLAVDPTFQQPPGWEPGPAFDRVEVVV